LESILTDSGSMKIVSLTFILLFIFSCGSQSKMPQKNEIILDSLIQMGLGVDSITCPDFILIPVNKEGFIHQLFIRKSDSLFKLDVPSFTHNISCNIQRNIKGDVILQGKNSGTGYASYWTRFCSLIGDTLKEVFLVEDSVIETSISQDTIYLVKNRYYSRTDDEVIFYVDTIVTTINDSIFYKREAEIKYFWSDSAGRYLPIK